MAESRTCIDCGASHDRPQSRRCNRCVYLRKKARVDEWKAANAGRVRELSRESQRRNWSPARLAAITHLGGRCQRCGFDDERALEIDHVEGGGDRERKKRNRITFYREVAAGQRTDVQLLCLNCHRIKTCEESLFHANRATG